MHSLNKVFHYFTLQNNLLTLNNALYFHFDQENEFGFDLWVSDNGIII
jgi:hypothetical protein